MILDNDDGWYNGKEGRQPEGPVKKKKTNQTHLGAEYISTFLFELLKRCKLQQEQDPPNRSPDHQNTRASSRIG